MPQSALNLPLLKTLPWLAEHQHLALMLDYDGTLSPIVANPEQAFIDEAALGQLVRLSAHPHISLAIISGRSIEQLEKFLAPLFKTNALFCGMHGGQIYDPKTQITLKAFMPSQYLPVLADFKARLLAELTPQNLLHSGLTLEEKSCSIALHTRNMQQAAQKTQAIALFKATARTITESASALFKLQPGKEVLELVPAIFSKAVAAEFLYEFWQQKSARPILLCYIGDDLTDEPAFTWVNAHNGISIAVGKTHPETTEARYHLENVAQVHQLLGRLL
ncbi:MAG: trehalose-phosphatase [Vampirovibrionales bacterium]|nr:trehalose-phosphatase [Vampirovibrionales bacterium]